jgi:hypothetical protein
VDASGRVFALLGGLGSGGDILLAIPPLEPGEHRIRKDLTVPGRSLRLHAPVPALP